MNIVLTKILGGIAACTAVALLPGSATAQTPGKYVGTTADKQTITWTVAKDAASGKLYISSLSYNIATKCQPGNSTFNTGWGVGADAKGRTIAAGKAAYLYAFGYLYVTANLVFSGNTVTGAIASETPTFAPIASGAPRKSVFCRSLKQNFTASFTTAADAPLGNAQAVVFGTPAQ